MTDMIYAMGSRNHSYLQARLAITLGNLENHGRHCRMMFWVFGWRWRKFSVEMRKLKLYLETSVWNFYFADDAPEKKETTVRFFHKVKQGTYEIYISDTVLEEIGNASEEEKRRLFNLIGQYQPKNIPIIPEMLNLSRKYLSENALPRKANKDAVHAAVATVSEMDALISWNLKHLSNLRRMEKINGINLKEGFTKRLELITPMEVSCE